MALMMEKMTTDFSHSGEKENFSIFALYFSQSDDRDASSRYKIFSAILFKESSSLFMHLILAWLAAKVKLKAFY
jgi:hypothetical protein